MDSVKTFLFADTTLKIQQYGINTTDTVGIADDFLFGYISNDYIKNKDKSKLLPKKNNAGINIFPHKIFTNESDTNAVMEEIVNLVTNNDYISNINSTQPVFLPPNYLKTTTKH